MKNHNPPPQKKKNQKNNNKNNTTTNQNKLLNSTAFNFLNLWWSFFDINFQIGKQTTKITHIVSNNGVWKKHLYEKLCYNLVTIRNSKPI